MLTMLYKEYYNGRCWKFILLEKRSLYERKADK